MKKAAVISVMLMLAVIYAAPQAAAAQFPEALVAPTEISAENLIVEEYQYRTLIYYTLGDDIIDVLSTLPSMYSALTIEGLLYVQFRIDGGAWTDYLFSDFDEEGSPVQSVSKQLTMSRKNSVSVLSLIQEQERGQLPEGTYYYDSDYPKNSYLLIFDHSFQFRVSVALEWIDLTTLTTQTLRSPWSETATSTTTVTAETLPSELRTPVIMSALPRDGETGAEIAVTAKPPLQITLVDSFMREQSEAAGVALEAQISLNNGDWMAMQPVGGGLDEAFFTIPAELEIADAFAARNSNLRVRFRYAAYGGAQLISEWTEAEAVGEYTEQSLNPDFEKPSFLRSSFLGIDVWVWMAAGSVLLMAGLVCVLMRRRRY